MKEKYLIIPLLAAAVFLFSESGLFSAKPGKIIFSNRQIKKGLEKRVPLKTEFRKGEVIWARAFFSRKLGRLKRGEELNLDLWIDGRFKRRVKVAKPKANWRQMQIYVHNTGDDDFKKFLFDSLGSGKHKISVKVVHVKFMKKKKVFRRGRIYLEDVFKPVYLSDGSFNYIVP